MAMAARLAHLCAMLALLLVALLAAFVHAKSVPVYVMLGLDVVTNARTVHDPAGLDNSFHQLQQGGVSGVMVDMWWGLVERDGPKQYFWQPYVQILDLARKYGLKAHVITSFHQCGGNVGDSCDVPLPPWVLNVSAGNSDIFYKDREGNANREYLSLGVDNEQLFSGRTPVQMYSDLMIDFKNSVLKNYVDTITEIMVSLGPAGELRYPSYPLSRWTFPGVGEFQCYDRYMLAQLKAAASAAGHPEWGTSGPANAGRYSDMADNVPFFQQGVRDNYASDYGKFFLNWYATVLQRHGDQILSAAQSIYQPYLGTNFHLSAKVSGVHWYYQTDHHAAELTAGYYNANGNNAYRDLAALFRRRQTGFDFTCVEMRDSEQPASCKCGPEELVRQVTAATQATGCDMGAENALPRYDATAYAQMLSQARAASVAWTGLDYLRLGPDLLNGHNWPLFTQFVAAMRNVRGNVNATATAAPSAPVLAQS